MSLPILPLQAAAAPATPPEGWPLLRLGFRPFYLGAAALAALALPLWLALLWGRSPLQPVLPGLLWHAHEMLFGFAAAVIVGFLMTAGKAWTGLPTPRGPWLGALALLWLAARITALSGPYGLFAVLDLALLPLVCAVLLERLLRARNRRNLPLAGILALLGLSNLAFHLAQAGAWAIDPRQALYAALALIVMIECVMGGRVIPAFTASATPGLRLVPAPRLELATLASTALALLAWVLNAQATAQAVLLLAAAALNAQRLCRWQGACTRGRPILWILHAAYAWLPLGLALLAAAALGWLPTSLGLHALAVGLTGGLIIGMVTRTARGHTGRALQVGRAEVTAYALVLGAAAVRVALPALNPAWTNTALLLAGLGWSLAFTIYLWIYTPWLCRTRLDGKDG